MTEPGPHVRDSAPPGPRAEYERRLAARAARVETCSEREARLANLRLALFVLTGVALWLAWGRLPAAFVLVPALAGFISLLVTHGRVRGQLERSARAVAFYERGLRRLDGRFAGEGPSGDEWLEGKHPYADHLDILGHGSLFDFLCGARTAAGRETVARWLLAPAPPTMIRARQAAARELRDRLDLREDLAVLEERVLEAFGAREIAAWAEADPALPSGGIRILPLALAAGAVAAAAAWPWVGPAPFVWLLLAELAIWLGVKRRVQPVIEACEGPSEALRQVHGVLERLGRERFESPRLRELDAALGGGQPPAAETLAGLLRRLDALEARENQIFLPVALALMWGTNCAFAIERWRDEHGDEIARWIAAVGEVEALLDLARLAYERPGYAFPNMVEGDARFETETLAHPLLPGCTPNDVALGGGGPDLLVVTGSNMSGKSTLLRTVGVAAVLAQAGAPVRAGSLTMSPLAVGASIRAVDSLLEGESRFYAEIHAIKRAMAAAERHPPGLFLLDELLHGTNSHDRRIGAESILRGFLERGAIGIATTHDLALADIANALGERAANRHFEFDLEEEGIHFDYTLRPGVVRSGNALEIMRAAGLEM